ncbi:uncharacterized protein [Prorops nasuta]|uniref:uncharacterized protein n=1 Tax=Prorops nasuta TaxID=863751 RepID=UPI0034CE4664
MIAAMSAIAIRRNRMKTHQGKNLKYEAEPPQSYVCGKISRIRTVMVFMLMGAMFLIGGMVQMTQGTPVDGSMLVYPISGAILIIIGLIFTRVSCTCLECMNTPSPVATPVTPLAYYPPEVPKIVVDSQHADGQVEGKAETLVHYEQHRQHRGPPPEPL